MSVLRRAFVKVAPDTSTFDKELKERLAKIKADEPGDKVAKSFSTAFSRRLDKQLKALHIPPIDLTANPRDALAAINKTQRELEALRDNADTLELKIKAESAISQLGRFRRQVGEIGPEAAEGFAARFGARIGPLMASVPLSPGLGAAAAVAGAIVAPTVAGALAAGVVGGAAGVGIVGGVILAARDPRVAGAGKELGQALLGDLEHRAQRWVDPVLAGIVDIRQGWGAMGPDLDRIFMADRFVDPLVDDVLQGSRKLIKGVADAVENADPVVDSFGDLVNRVGGAVGQTFTLLAADAEEGASALDDISGSLEYFILTSGQLIHYGAQIKGFFDDVDKHLDETRYAIEDAYFFRDWLDVTADGFEKGSAEAEAYRRTTLGTATAADEALLAQAALSGATGDLEEDQRIAAVAALQLARNQMENARTAEVADQNQKSLKETQTALTAVQEGLSRTLDNLNPGYQRATQLVDQLRQASERLYGATINQTEANETYEASWDQLSGSVKANKGSLDIHTEAGRANRDALQGLLGSSNELYYANLEAGLSTDQARKKHEQRTEAVRKEAERLGLNKKETERLIETYGNIPPKKTTNLILDGVKTLVDRLFDVYLAQRALAEGKTVEQIRGGLGRSSEWIKRAEGGPISGPGTSTSDSVPVLASTGEHMWSAADVVAAGGHQAVYALRAAARSGMLGGWLRRAGGGPIAPVDESRRWPMHVDVGDAFVMSKREALSRVTPGVPEGGATAPFMVRVLRQAFPGLSLISGFRPGSRTLSGSLSLHALNRAVDYPPNWDMARWVWQNYRSKTKEFISPYQEYNILNGRQHTYTGAVWRQHNFAGGNAHNHWAMDGGGYLMPGWNGPIFNGTGRPEPVTPPSTMDEVVDELQALRGQVAGLAAELGEVLTGARRHALIQAKAR